MDLLQREHPKILAGIGLEYVKKAGFSATKALISQRWGKIGPMLLLTGAKIDDLE